MPAGVALPDNCKAGISDFGREGVIMAQREQRPLHLFAVAARRYEPAGKSFSRSSQGADTIGTPQAIASNIRMVGMPGSARA